MNHKVEFRYNDFIKNIVMEIVSNDSVIFQEIVTEDVLRVTEEFKDALKR
ncbi:hypothetical protein [Bacillus pumilus]|nr:hypothetical protein [Bacillus pumilus]